MRPRHSIDPCLVLYMQHSKILLSALQNFRFVPQQTLYEACNPRMVVVHTRVLRLDQYASCYHGNRGYNNCAFYPWSVHIAFCLPREKFRMGLKARITHIHMTHVASLFSFNFHYRSDNEFYNKASDAREGSSPYWPTTMPWIDKIALETLMVDTPSLQPIREMLFFEQSFVASNIHLVSTWTMIPRKRRRRRWRSESTNPFYRNIRFEMFASFSSRLMRVMEESLRETMRV